MTRSVNPKNLSNYSAGILRFTQFCDCYHIPEALRMPAPEWLLSIFITIRGAASVGGGATKTWLLGLKLWHLINRAPWYGGSHLKRASKGSKALAPQTSSRPPHPLVTICHLKSLKHHLILTDTFDTAIYGTATVAFWCQCRLSEVTVKNHFDAAIHALRSSPQKSGSTASNIKFHSFRAPHTKTHCNGEDIHWTDSGCAHSAVPAFNNHWLVNSHVPPSAHIFAFETADGNHAPMRRLWFLSRCNEIWAKDGLATLSGHSFGIGGTTHLLLMGVDPFIIMAQGSWHSLTFLNYWRLCEEILPTFIGFSLSSKSSLVSNMAVFKSCILNPL